MAIPTPKDIRLRVEAILGTIPQIETVILDDDCPMTDDMLPAVLVMIRRGEHQQTNTTWWLADRVVEIGALFTRLCGDTLEEQRLQLLTAEALLEVIPDTFNRLDRLYLATGDPKRLSVQDVGQMTDNGLETRLWGEQDVYYACTYSFTIRTQRQ